MSPANAVASGFGASTIDHEAMLVEHVGLLENIVKPAVFWILKSVHGRPLHKPSMAINKT